jgi:hypothetical protein
MTAACGSKKMQTGEEDRPLNSMVSCEFNGRLKPSPYQPTTVEQDDCWRRKKMQKGET